MKRYYVSLPPELQETVYRSHRHFVSSTRRGVTSAVRNLGTAFAGVSAGVEALAGFAEAIRPYKQRKLFDKGSAMEEGELNVQTFVSRKAKSDYRKLGGGLKRKLNTLSHEYQTWHWRCLGNSQWGNTETKTFYRVGGGGRDVVTVGSLPMLNMSNVGMSSIANKGVQLLPVYLFSLTDTPNWMLDPGTTTKQFRALTNNCQLMKVVDLSTSAVDYTFYPLYKYAQVGSVTSTAQARGLKNNGDTYSNADSPAADIWQPRRETSTVYAEGPLDKGILKRVNIKLDLWGAKKAPTRWSIQLVQFSEGDGPEYTNVLFPPNDFGGSLSSQYIGKGQSGSAAILHKSLWNRECDHPWNVDSVPRSSRMKVLASWVHHMNPNWTGEDDTRPHNLLLNYTVDLNRKLNYAWYNASEIPNSDNVNAVEPMLGVVNQSVEVHPNARIYLLVKCDNYKLVDANVTPEVTVTDDYVPSFNVVLEQTMVIAKSNA